MQSGVSLTMWPAKLFKMMFRAHFSAGLFILENLIYRSPRLRGHYGNPQSPPNNNLQTLKVRSNGALNSLIKYMRIPGETTIS